MSNLVWTWWLLNWKWSIFILGTLRQGQKTTVHPFMLQNNWIFAWLWSDAWWCVFIDNNYSRETALYNYEVPIIGIISVRPPALLIFMRMKGMLCWLAKCLESKLGKTQLEVVLILLPVVNVVRSGRTWGDKVSLQGKILILNSLETLKMSHKVSWNVCYCHWFYLSNDCIKKKFLLFALNGLLKASGKQQMFFKEGCSWQYSNKWSC